MAASDLLMEAAVLAPLVLLLAAAARTDLRDRRIPDGINAALLALGLAVAVFGVGTVPWPMALAGAGAGLVVTAAARLLLGRRAVGLGDVKMTTAVGAWLGPGGLALAMIVACLGVLLGAAWRRSREAAPFAPYLAAGVLAVYGLGLWAAGTGAA